ncbi:MAG: hypothetical protein QOH88_2682 [Verrucomicrobiota bacterium]|jgi:hypothetical protein
MNKDLFCSRRPVGGAELAAAIVPTLRTAKRLQKMRRQKI